MIGVAFLKIEHSDKDDEMRMWLPEFKKYVEFHPKEGATLLCLQI